MAFEVKTPSGKLSRLQEVTIQKIIDAGGITGKVTNLEEVVRMIENI
jgi:hypothetical protein